MSCAGSTFIFRRIMQERGRAKDIIWIPCLYEVYTLTYS
jgi:hypothetical protein